MRLKGPAKAGIAGGVLVLACAAHLWRRTKKREVAKLAAILGWRAGASVADVGAGSGALTIAAALSVGGHGHVFATEVDPRKINRIRNKASSRGLRNVTVLQAGVQQLPHGCCDAALLRGSYHHFTDPAAGTQDLFNALRPGGIVAVLDFPPRRWLTLIAPLKGVPANRGGHGIPADVLMQEMQAAGFEVQEMMPRWFLDVYCVVFRKPAA